MVVGAKQHITLKDCDYFTFTRGNRPEGALPCFCSSTSLKDFSYSLFHDPDPQKTVDRSSKGSFYSMLASTEKRALLWFVAAAASSHLPIAVAQDSEAGGGDDEPAPTSDEDEGDGDITIPTETSSSETTEESSTSSSSSTSEDDGGDESSTSSSSSSTEDNNDETTSSSSSSSSPSSDEDGDSSTSSPDEEDESSSSSDRYVSSESRSRDAAPCSNLLLSVQLYKLGQTFQGLYLLLPIPFHRW